MSLRPTPVSIGRNRELAQLLSLVTTPPALGVVVGEAGVGKTRLVEELMGDPTLEHHRVLVGRCHPLREPFPLGPLIEALRGAGREWASMPLSPIAGVLRPLLPELASSLPRRPRALGDPCAERHRVFRALRELLALGPTVCVLEDLHWADEGTREFLSFLLSEPPEMLSFVVTYRGEDLSGSAAPGVIWARTPHRTAKARVQLAPLSWEQGRELAAALLATDNVSEQFARSLHERSAGIPFVIEEIVRVLRHRGELDGVDGQRCSGALERLDAPPAVRDWILDRVSALTTDTQLIIRAAAVLGRPVGEGLMAKVAGLASKRGATGLSSALSCAMLGEKQARLYGFRCPIAAQAVYEQIPGPDRVRLHLRAARALASAPKPGSFAELAHHFKQADRPMQGARYAEAAAEAAISVGDDRGAARLLAEALQAPGVSRAAARRMTLKLGDAALFGRVPRKAIPILRRAVRDSSAPIGLRGQLRLSLARLLLLTGDSSSSYRELVRAARELARRPGLAAQALSVLAEARLLDGDGQQQLAWVDRALETSARQDDPSVTTRMHAVRAYVLLEAGDPSGWRALEQLPWDASSSAQRLELVRACKYCAQAALGLGHHRRARALLENAGRIRHDLGHGRFAVGLGTLSGWLDWISGRWEGLEPRARGLLDASVEAPEMAATNEMTLASLLLARGEVADAAQRFSSLLGVVHDSRRPAVTTALARIHVARREDERALELAMMGLEQIRTHGLWTCASIGAAFAVDLLAANAMKAEAEEVARELAHGLRARDAPAAKAALSFCRGAIAQADRCADVAERCFAQAERAWRRLPSPYEAARTRERRGRCLLAVDAELGLRCLTAALADFDALGADWDAGRVRAELRAQGMTLPYPWRGGRKGYGKELSPREAEVVRLARIGLTNREIGDELFISRRTVEEHVTSALRKLDIGSKRELIATGRAGGAKVP